MPPTLSKPVDQFELNKLMRARAEALTSKFKELGIPLQCLYTSWEDAMRAFGCSHGPNITDVGLVFRNQAGREGSAETFGFKIRSANFNEIILEIDARIFNIVVCDPDAQKPRLVTLAFALENAGKLFKHCGLPEDCNLYCPELDNGKVKLGLDIIYAPQGEKKEGEEFAQKEFSMTGYSYQGRDGNARNITLWAHPQGTACADDGNGKQYLRPQVYDEAKKELSSFWVEGEDTGKSVKDMHTETQAESQAAADRGKGTAVRTGMNNWDRLPNIFHSIQIPRVQDRPAPVRQPISAPVSYASTAAQWNNAIPAAKKAKGIGGSPLAAPFDEEDGEDGGGEGGGNITYRSLAAPAPPSEVTSARLSRGSYAGVDPGVKSKTVVRAKEPIRIQSTLVFMLSSEEPPETAAVKDTWAVVQRMVKLAGEAKELMDPDAGLTTGKPLTEEDAMDIADKQKEHPAPPQVPDMPTAPIVGMVTDELVAVA